MVAGLSGILIACQLRVNCVLFQVTRKSKRTRTSLSASFISRRFRFRGLSLNIRKPARSPGFAFDANPAFVFQLAEHPLDGRKAQLGQNLLKLAKSRSDPCNPPNMFDEKFFVRLLVKAPACGYKPLPFRGVGRSVWTGTDEFLVPSPGAQGCLVQGDTRTLP